MKPCYLFFTLMHFPLCNSVLKRPENIQFSVRLISTKSCQTYFHRLENFVHCRDAMTTLTDNVGTQCSCHVFIVVKSFHDFCGAFIDHNLFIFSFCSLKKNTLMCTVEVQYFINLDELKAPIHVRCNKLTRDACNQKERKERNK